LQKVPLDTYFAIVKHLASKSGFSQATGEAAIWRQFATRSERITMNQPPNPKNMKTLFILSVMLLGGCGTYDPQAWERLQQQINFNQQQLAAQQQREQQSLDQQLQRSSQYKPYEYPPNMFKSSESSYSAPSGPPTRTGMQRTDINGTWYEYDRHDGTKTWLPY
jgi:hypothetical protein